MVIRAFPPVENADDSGLLAVGGDLEVESLLLAYSSGIFPWPIVDDTTLTWFCPPQRAVLFLDDFELPRSLRKERSKTNYTYSFNSAFAQVINGCAESANRQGQDGTWITSQILSAYVDFHRAGHGFSVECWDCGSLIGGLYGVTVGAMVAGESLFYRISNASKLCLWCLVEYLKSRGVEWIDCQQMTPLLESFGATVLPRSEFIDLVAEAVGRDVRLFSPGEAPPKDWQGSNEES
ncbi:MAG: leucyl/phenylalanyl-tRNA--protein transferase [Bdellovibrionales bacterium]|nr:leucyl/phenylalanyl-tRNA--protein transferase [Bdellovibrionales bacterium]